MEKKSDNYVESRRGLLAKSGLVLGAASIMATPQLANAVPTNTLASGFIDVTDPSYGADPTGNTSSSSAFTSAIADAMSSDLVLWVPPGTYDLQSMGTINVNKLNIMGAGKELVTIIGSSVSDLFNLQADSVITLSAIGVEGFRRVITCPALDVDVIEVTNCSFSNIPQQVVGSGAGVDMSMINRFIFSENIASNIGDSNADAAAVKLSSNNAKFISIQNNQINNIGSSTKTNKSYGVFVRAFSGNEQGDSRSVITGNVIRNVRNNSTQDCVGIMVLGGTTVIEGNQLEDVITNNTASSDCEGIYTKCINSIIASNTLSNCGGREGVIICKGLNRNETSSPGPSSPGYDNIIKGNVIFQDEYAGRKTTGIALTMDGCICSENRITGTFIGVSVWDDAKNCKVSGNIIYGLSNYGTSHSVSGITAKHPVDLQIIDNQIVALSSDGVCYGIYLNCSGATYTGCIIRGNWINDLTSSDSSLSRGIALNLNANDSCTKLIVESNHINNVGRGLQGYNISTSNHSAAIYNSFNNCSVSTFSPVTGWTVNIGN